jgi:hypothetical protein
MRHIFSRIPFSNKSLFFKLLFAFFIIASLTLAIVFPSPWLAQTITQLTLPSEGSSFIPSRFDLDMEMLKGPNAGTKFTLDNLTDIMVASRSNPFDDDGSGVDKSVEIPLKFEDQKGEGRRFRRLERLRRQGLSARKQFKYSDFGEIPKGFRGKGKAIIVNIDSIDAESPDGVSRLLVGQPVKDMFPKVYKPGLGIIKISGREPGKSVWIPYGVIMTKYGNFIANAPGYVNPIFAYATPPSQRLSKIPYGLEDEGESFRAVKPSLLVSVDDPTGSPVARINKFYFTNAITENNANGEIVLAPPEKQPKVKRDLGEKFTNSEDPKILYPNK